MASALAGALATAVAVPAGAGADPTSGAVTVTINVAPLVRSIMVETASGSTQDTICSASQPLAFPNGECSAGDYVTVTNGAVPSHIEIYGADAVPADGGTSWQLCGGVGGPTCSGPAAGAFSYSPLGGSPDYPGQDQYQVQTETEGGDGPALSNSQQCDTAYFGMDCQATAGQSIPESIVLIGPAASSDSSQTFTSSITWVAGP